MSPQQVEEVAAAAVDDQHKYRDDAAVAQPCDVRWPGYDPGRP
jgi:hypothetical protein